MSIQGLPTFPFSTSAWAGVPPQTGGLLQHFGQGREIYAEGDDAEQFFQVISGVVRTCRFLSDGRRQIDAFHVAGDVFGLEAPAEYNLSAEAVNDCSVMSYRHRGLAVAASKDPGLSERLFSYAIRNLARAQEHAQLLCRKSAMERVGAFLADWGDHVPGSGMVNLAMTRQDIADYLGLTIETVSRSLSQLEREGVIAFSTARQIRLTNPTALRELNS